MKRKLLLALLAAIACLSGAFGLTACGEGETNVHTHNWSDWSVADEDKPSDTAPGKATRYCDVDGCDATEADKECTLPELTSKDYIITNNTATCKAEGTATYSYSNGMGGGTVNFTAVTPVDANAHAYSYTYEDETGHWQVCANDSTHTTDKEAHDEKGEDGACSVCQYKEEEATPPSHTHTLKEEIAKAATCEAAGHEAYYTCSGCDKWFSDANGKTEITDKDSVVTKKLGHNAAKAWTQENDKHYHACLNTGCSEKLDEKSCSGGAATCVDKATCTVCKNKYGEIDATNHSWSEWTVEDDNKPDDEKTGMATRTCNNACGSAAKNDTQYELPVLSSEDYAITGNTATCEDDGTATYTYNKNKVSVSFVAETPATGHTEEVLPATVTCTEAGLTAGVKCSVCGDILTAQESVEALGHTERVIPAKAASCRLTGLTAGVECSVCGDVLTAQTIIPAKGHSLSANNTAPTVDEEHKTVSKICPACNKTISYTYDNAVLNASVTSINQAPIINSGINYVSQTITNPYLGYTFDEAGTYSIYWVNLNSTLYISTATFGGSTAGFIDSNGNAKLANIPNGFVYEGYCRSDYTYYVTDEDGNVVTNENGNKVSTTAHAGDYVRLVKNSILTTSLSSIIPVKLTFDVEAGKTFKFRNVALDASELNLVGSLVGIGKQPVETVNLPAVAEGSYTMTETEYEFADIAEATAGTYTFTAETGKFNLYVNGRVYSDGKKSYFGYVDFKDNYLTVTLNAGDTISVEKVSGKTFEIRSGEVAEPPAPTYSALNLSDNAITLPSDNITTNVYESGDQAFYSFTAPESGYYMVSVADDVKVHVVTRVDRDHYKTVFDVVGMGGTHSGAFYAEQGETVILAFVANSVSEFNVNIVSCEEPVMYLKVNETIDNIYFDGIETFIKLTVDESVADGEYEITFVLPMTFAYVYFSVNKEIEVDDIYDRNAVGKYVNDDLAAGADHTVGDATKRPNTATSHWDSDYTRTVTVKAGDVIYLATTTPTSGKISVTITPVAEADEVTE